MLFNSISFAFFLPTIFILYWFLFKKSNQSSEYTITLFQLFLLLMLGLAICFPAGIFYYFRLPDRGEYILFKFASVKKSMVITE